MKILILNWRDPKDPETDEAVIMHHTHILRYYDKDLPMRVNLP